MAQAVTSLSLGAGIGDGLYWNYPIDSAATILIDGDTASLAVTAISNNGSAAGIGGRLPADITITGGTVIAMGAGTGGHGDGNQGGKITIGGSADVSATSNTGAGIGGGGAITTTTTGGAGGEITIEGSADVSAESTTGAGIGGGGSAAAGTIAISGGTVIAISATKGTAIGGGWQVKTGSIKISGGTIIASTSRAGYDHSTGPTADGTRAGTIGRDTGGWTATTIYNGTNDNDFNDLTPNKPVIFATYINDKSSEPSNGIACYDTALAKPTGALLDGSTGTITLLNDFTVPSGATLTVPPGWELEIPSGKTLINNGTIIQKPSGSYSGTAPVGNAVVVEQ